MEEPEEEIEEPRFDWRSVDWRLWLSRVLVGGIILWLVAGAIRIILQVFFVSPAGYIFTPNEFSARGIVRFTSWSLAVETVAYRAWLASAVLLGFLWLQDRPPRAN